MQASIDVSIVGWLDLLVARAIDHLRALFAQVFAQDF